LTNKDLAYYGIPRGTWLGFKERDWLADAERTYALEWRVGTGLLQPGRHFSIKIL